MVLCAVYAIWLHNRINFGTLKTKYIVSFKDLTLRELHIFLFFAILTLLLGVYPTPIINTIHTSLSFLLNTL
jgi:NADH:ubiquinone oxidoreductase subunit 4 (subunit M)